jgi:hypothetical protein
MRLSWQTTIAQSQHNWSDGDCGLQMGYFRHVAMVAIILSRHGLFGLLDCTTCSCSARNEILANFEGRKVVDIDESRRTKVKTMIYSDLYEMRQYLRQQHRMFI